MVDEHTELLAITLFQELCKDGETAQSALGKACAGYPAAASLLSDYALTSAHFTTTQAKASDLDAIYDRQSKTIASKLMSTAPYPLRGITARASELKIEVQDLCDTLRIGRSILVKLDRRLISLSTISARFIEKLASSLQLSRDVLTAYLSQPPQLASSAEYRSRTAPKAGRKESFDRSIAASIASGRNHRRRRYLLERRGGHRWINRRSGNPRSPSEPGHSA